MTMALRWMAEDRAVMATGMGGFREAGRLAPSGPPASMAATFTHVFPALGAVLPAFRGLRGEARATRRDSGRGLPGWRPRSATDSLGDIGFGSFRHERRWRDDRLFGSSGD